MPLPPEILGLRLVVVRSATVVGQHGPVTTVVVRDSAGRRWQVTRPGNETYRANEIFVPKDEDTVVLED
jgi:hypothetical protein